MLGLVRPLIARVSRRTPLGFKQLTHDKLRLLVALSGIAFADVLMFMQLGFQRALFDSNTQLHRSLTADIVLLNPQTENLISLVAFPRRRIYQALDVPGVAEADGIYGAITTWKNPDTRDDKPLAVFGLDPGRDLFNIDGIRREKYRLRVPGAVLFDRQANGPYGETIATIDGGQAVTTEVNDRTIQVVGLFEVGASFAADGFLVMSERTFLESFPRHKPGSIGLGAIHVEPGADPAFVAAQLNQHLPEDTIALTLPEFIAFEEQYWAENTAIGFVFSLGTIMGFIVGMVIVYQVLATDVNDHLPEYATFKAMGYTDRYLLGVVFEEALILACIGFIPGVVFSSWMYGVTKAATNLPIAMTVVRAAQVLGLTIVMCCVSGAIATQRLRSADPADIF
jgi:putative ABC transport system permease protein